MLIWLTDSSGVRFLVDVGNIENDDRLEELCVCGIDIEGDFQTYPADLVAFVIAATQKAFVKNRFPIVTIANKYIEEMQKNV